MRILLTGAAGFIGAATSRMLRDAGHDVVAVDAMLEQAHGARRPPDDVYPLDVRDARDWPREAWRGVDAVCHLAAVVGAGARVGDLPLYAAHNDLGTAALLAAMHDAEVHRLVLASSMVVYGEGRYLCPEHGHRPQPAARSVADLRAGRFENACDRCGGELGWDAVDEDAALEPRSTYAASKLAQEHYARAWVRLTDARAVALRYHNVYGPGMPRNTPYSGVAALFRSALERGEAPRVFEDGGQMRDFVHVDDVARANLAALEALTPADDTAPASFSAYNVASGHPISILEVARLVAAGAGTAVDPLVTGEFRLGDVRHVVASPARALHDLGFRAAVAPEDGLAAFATAPLRD